MIKKYIPNLLTFTNLWFGVFSILEIIKGNYVISAVCILISALIDRYDGRIAWYLNETSDIGRELDSLADMVSFGIAPALLIFCKLDFPHLGVLKIIGIGCLILYVTSGAYRLARYNTKTFDGVFTGIPITIAGCILALYSLALPEKHTNAYLAFILMATLSFLMVSKIKLRKL